MWNESTRRNGWMFQTSRSWFLNVGLSIVRRSSQQHVLQINAICKTRFKLRHGKRRRLTGRETISVGQKGSTRHSTLFAGVAAVFPTQTFAWLFEHDGAETWCMESLAKCRPWAQVIQTAIHITGAVPSWGHPNEGTKKRKTAREDAN